MPTQTFKLKYAKNTGRVFSADEIRSLYFFGIPIVDPSTGEEMSDEVINFYIDATQESMENYLDVLMTQQIYTESGDFYYKDWTQWGYTPTRFPVKEPISIQGFLNTTLQINYPQEWLSVKTTSRGSISRKINLVPIHGSANSLSSNVVYVGIAPHVNYFGSRHIPNYWEIKYVSGFSRVPKDIMNAMGKLISINIFHQLGDIIVGAGVASKSIGLDGMSQSISTTASATNSGYGARIIGYLKDLEKAEVQLRNTYKGIKFSVA